jgi:hypothetical protein
VCGRVVSDGQLSSQLSLSLSLAPPQTKKHSEARPRVRLNTKQRQALISWLDEYGGACAMVET